MSAEPQASSEGGTEPPAMDVIRKLDDITVGVRVEAKDCYGKWFCAKVVEKDEETEEIVIHFDGWSSRYDELVHIGEGRLRHLSREQLQKTSRTCKHKPVGVGDRVQARWHDGRMYYGRVLKLLNQMAVVLFDDGVEYTAPINAVRKRKVEPSPVSSRGESSSLGLPGISERKRRLIERRGREDSASQPSTSPPSSPLFAPKRIPSSRSNQFWETDESSCTESDEEGSSKRQRRDSSLTYCTSSDGDLQPPHGKRGKRPNMELREPYKLRKQLSRQQYAPVARKRKSKEPASSSAGETVALPASDGGMASGRESGARKGGPAVVKKERDDEEEKDRTLPWKSSDEDALIPETVDGAVENRVSGGIKKEESEVGVNPSRSKPDSSNPCPHLPPSSPTPLSTPDKPPTSPGHACDAVATDNPNEPTASSSPPGLRSLSKLKMACSSSRKKSGSGSVTTRFRAQTTFENSKLGKRKEKGRQGKVAPKELVIMWDHNEFKCTHAGCTKSFRKQSLLESHMKHYHDIMPFPRRGKTMKVPGDRTPVGKSPQSPSTSLTNNSPKTPASLPATASSSSHLSPTTSPSLPLSPSLQPSPKKAKLSEYHDPTVQEHEKVGPLTTDNTATKTSGSKSPKKSRPKSSLSKSSATDSTAAVLQSMSGQQKHTSSPSSSTTSSSSPPSKHKQSSGKKHRDGKYHKETSRKGGEMASKSQTSPSIPSSSAAVVPLQRSQGTAGSWPGDVTAATGGESSKQDGVGGSDVKSEANLPSGTPGKGGAVEGDSRSVEQLSRSTSPCSEANDDVVHCVCGDNTDEGFMIQCEQCLCWQHGDCIGISKASLPKQYLCCFCTNPPGLRQNRKYQYDLQWYCDGTLPSLPGGPKFPCPDATLKCHILLDKLYLLRKMSHSSKVKLQAASTPNHSYLRQWSKECACLDKETLKNYLAAALQPIVTRGPETTQNTAAIESPACTSSNSNSLSTVVKPETESAGGVEVASSSHEKRKLANGDRISEGPKGPMLLPLEKQKSTGSVKMSVLAGPTQSSIAQGTSVPKSRDLSRDQVVERETADISGTARLPHDTGGTLRSTSTEPDFTSEFGVQETSVFAVKESENVPQPNSPKQQKPSESVKTPATPTTLPAAIPTVSLLTQKKPLQQSNTSAFKPVVITAARQSIGNPSTPPGSAPIRAKTPTCTSSQLTSLLTSPISTHPQSLVQPPTSSSTSLPACSSQTGPPPNTAANITEDTVGSLNTSAPTSNQQPASQSTTPTTSEPCATQLSRLKLVPNVGGDPIFTETASSLQPSQDSPPPAPVLVRDFTEAFVRGDTTNWFKRMLLMDHIEAVQDGILRWVEQMEKEVDDLSGEEEEEEDGEAEDVISGIQATLDRLNTFHCQIIGKTQ